MYTLQGLHISKVTLPPCPGQFTKLASDEARDRKKSAKRELQEKARQELAKVQDTLLTPISVYFRVPWQPCLSVGGLHAVSSGAAGQPWGGGGTGGSHPGNGQQSAPQLENRNKGLQPQI